MHAGRYLLVASVLLAEYVLAQDSDELHHNLKREEDWSFSPADIVKRQIPATGEKIVEPPAECVQACQGFIAFGVSCAQGKEASTLTDEELLTCACRADFLTALKSCAACAPQIFEGTDGSNAQTAIDDAAEQCTINGIPVPGFESTPDEDEYKCDPVDGEGEGGDTGGAIPGGDASASGTSKAPEIPAESPQPTGGESSSSESPSADESSKSATPVVPVEGDSSAAAAGPTPAPDETDSSEEDFDDFDTGTSSSGASSSSVGDDFGGDFGGASASVDSQRVLVFGIAAVTAIFACVF